MLFRTHLAFGFVLGALAIPLLHPTNQLVFIALVLLGSALPDLDHPQSKLGRKVKIFSMLFKHRGFLHSIFGMALLAFPFSLIFPQVYVLGVMLGYLSHLIGDAATREGVHPFAPVTTLRLRGPFRTGTVIEHALFVLFVILGVWKILAFL
jgi:inner membrane protein